MGSKRVARAVIITNEVLLPAHIVLWTLDTFKDIVDAGKCVNVITQASKIGMYMLLLARFSRKFWFYFRNLISSTQHKTTLRMLDFYLLGISHFEIFHCAYLTVQECLIICISVFSFSVILAKKI
jgi:hypothetical protein